MHGRALAGRWWGDLINEHLPSRPPRQRALTMPYYALTDLLAGGIADSYGAPAPSHGTWHVLGHQGPTGQCNSVRAPHFACTEFTDPFLVSRIPVCLGRPTHAKTTDQSMSSAAHELGGSNNATEKNRHGQVGLRRVQARLRGLLAELLHGLEARRAGGLQRQRGQV